MTPESAQIVRHRPTLPEYFRAPVGDTNIPDPIITPMIMLTADRRPMFRFKPTSPSLGFFSLIAAAFFENVEKYSFD